MLKWEGNGAGNKQIRLVFWKRLVQIIDRCGGATPIIALGWQLCDGRSWESKDQMKGRRATEILEFYSLLGCQDPVMPIQQLLSVHMILNVFWTAQRSRATRNYQGCHQFQQSLNSPSVWKIRMLSFLSLSFSIPHPCCSPSYLFPPSVQH